ncbi:hypothetical protein C0J52_25756 [Blattella germanica]|nr:hypothetical protein C0J52_25756 [Blattella germanica]
MLATEPSEKNGQRSYSCLDKMDLFERQTGELRSHMSALHFRMYLNAIYELETKKLHAIIQSSAA